MENGVHKDDRTVVWNDLVVPTRVAPKAGNSNLIYDSLLVAEERVNLKLSIRV